MPQFRKKPVVIEAVQFTGENAEEISAFCPKFKKRCYTRKPETNIIETLEGDMEVSEGDYIIKGVIGEFYPCKPDIFKETYESV